MEPGGLTGCRPQATHSRPALSVRKRTKRAIFTMRRKSDCLNRRLSDIKACPYGLVWPETGPVDDPGALGRCAIKHPGPDNLVKGIRYAAPARPGSLCVCGAACLSDNIHFTDISLAVGETKYPSG